MISTVCIALAFGAFVGAHAAIAQRARRARRRRLHEYWYNLDPPPRNVPDDVRARHAAQLVAEPLDSLDREDA